MGEVEKVLKFVGFKEKNKFGKFFWMIRWLILSPHLVLYALHFLLFSAPKYLVYKLRK